MSKCKPTTYMTGFEGEITVLRTLQQLKDLINTCVHSNTEEKTTDV